VKSTEAIRFPQNPRRDPRGVGPVGGEPPNNGWAMVTNQTTERIVRNAITLVARGVAHPLLYPDCG
jgi:hypothetical protein